MMIAGVWGGIISSAKILSRSSALLLIGALVPNDTGRGRTRVSRGMVGRFVQDCELIELLMATKTTLASAFGASVVEG